MLFFNIPDIFNFNNIFGQNDSHYTRNLGRDSRNSVLLEPLEISLANLIDIRSRIGSRIDVETASGTDMTDVLIALNSADQSLLSAEHAVATATSTVSGTDKHPAYWDVQTAYTNLNQTRDALNVVIDSIQNAVNQASSTSAIASSTKHQLTHTKNAKKTK